MNYELSFLVLATVYLLSHITWTTFFIRRWSAELKNLKYAIAHNRIESKLKTVIPLDDLMRVKKKQFEADEINLNTRLRWAEKEQTK